jgi:hypothetical protein
MTFRFNDAMYTQFSCTINNQSRIRLKVLNELNKILVLLLMKLIVSQILVSDGQCCRLVSLMRYWNIECCISEGECVSHV